MNKVKEIISLMENKIAEISLDVLSSKKVNIEEIVGLSVFARQSKIFEQILYNSKQELKPNAKWYLWF